MSHDDIRGIIITHEGKIIKNNDHKQSELKTGDSISTGDKITTIDGSVAVIALKSNSLLIIGPQTSFVVGHHGPDQLQHIHVQQGQMRVRKHPGREKHPNGSVFTFAQDSSIYQAEEFEIELTAEKKTLVLIQGQLKKLTQAQL